MDAYTIEMFANMFTDERRHAAYAEALKQSIRPGDVVVDIGTGLGTYAMLAAKLGARHVYAIEPNPLIQLASELADANGLSDRITFISDLSTEVELPELADVVFADLRGVLPFYTQNIASMRDARTRLLRPGGILIPTRDTIHIALASNPSGVSRYRDCWIANPFDLDLSPILEYSSHTVRDDRVEPEAMRSDPIQVAEIDYANGLDTTDFAYTGSLDVTTAGTVDGLAAWFEATLIDGITYATGPWNPPMVYSSAFFPFADSIEVTPGTPVSVALSARQAPDDTYIWDWAASGRDSRGEAWSVDHGTLRAGPIDISAVRKRAAGHRIADSAKLQADLLALRLLGEGRSLGEIVDEIAVAHPEVVAARSAMLGNVADLAARYDR